MRRRSNFLRPRDHLGGAGLTHTADEEAGPTDHPYFACTLMAGREDSRIRILEALGLQMELLPGTTEQGLRGARSPRAREFKRNVL